MLSYILYYAQDLPENAKPIGKTIQVELINAFHEEVYLKLENPIDVYDGKGITEEELNPGLMLSDKIEN